MLQVPHDTSFACEPHPWIALAAVIQHSYILSEVTDYLYPTYLPPLPLRQFIFSPPQRERNVEKYIPASQTRNLGVFGTFHRHESMIYKSLSALPPTSLIDRRTTGSRCPSTRSLLHTPWMKPMWYPMRLGSWRGRSEAGCWPWPVGGPGLGDRNRLDAICRSDS